MKNYYDKIDDLDKLLKGDHTVLIYEEEGEIISSSVSFILASLKRNEKCMYIEGDVSTEILMRQLEKNVPDIYRYLNRGQLQILNKEETYALSNNFEADKMINLLKKEALQSLEEGYNGLSITGELSWALNFDNGKEEIIKYEWKLNYEIFDDYPVIAMCRYDINKFDNEIIKAIIELHNYIIWKDKLHENPYYIEPEGYRDNKIIDYEIESWLNNIQEYQKNESKLKDKEDEYEFLFNKINDAVFLHKISDNNEFGNFIKVNEKACEMLGFSKEELLQMSPKDLDSPEMQEINRNRVVNTVPFENEIILESEHVSSTGEIIPVELSISYYEKGESSYLLTIARDISQRKKKEAKLIAAKDELQIKNETLEANNEEIRAMNESLDKYVNEINELNMRFIKMIDLFSKNTIFNEDENKFLKNILKTAIEVVPEANYGSAYIYESGKVNFIDVVGYDLKKLQEIDIPSEAFHNKESQIETLNFNEIKDRNKKLMDDLNHNKLEKNAYKMKEIMQMDLEVAGKKRAGISLDIDSESYKNYSDNSLKIFTSFYNLASSFYNLKEYNKLQSSFTKELVTSIIKLLEMHDLYTKGHSENVANISSRIAKEMNLPQKIVDDTYWAGLVHDIGKVLIPVDILNKKSKLTNEEFELIKKHPELGAEVLKNSDSLNNIWEYVKYHHESWDGNGYPEGLSQNSIPLVAQIVKVADAWDAMTSQRSYRDALSFDEALKEIKENKGSQFSPKVVEVFLNSNIIEDRLIQI